MSYAPSYFLGDFFGYGGVASSFSADAASNEEREREKRTGLSNALDHVHDQHHGLLKEGLSSVCFILVVEGLEIGVHEHHSRLARGIRRV